MARAGETVELAERAVTIHALELVSWDDTDPERPIAVVDVACSAGTYVRALARDLGERLGSAAYLGALTRTASGPFTLDGGAIASTRSGAAAADGPAGLMPLLLPIDAGLDAFPVVTLTADEVAAIARGQFVRPAGRPARARPTTTGCATTPARSSRSRPRPAAGSRPTRSSSRPRAASAAAARRLTP